VRRPTRWVALAVGLVIAAFGVLLAVQSRDEASVPRLVREHEAAPVIRARTIDGRPVDTAALAGRTYVVNFFNSWCIPCLDELPALRDFYAAHRSDPDFAMIGVVRDDEEAAIRDFVRREGIAWPVVFDGADRIGLDFGTTGQPETYVVAPDGIVVCGALGESSREALEAWLGAARAGQECV
jgi:cytochrome c biogenesis protein CcmG, thiol:disulfide interchange protein DsbE